MPQTVVPPPTQTLSPADRAPPSSSHFNNVDFPGPPGAARAVTRPPTGPRHEAAPPVPPTRGQETDQLGQAKRWNLWAPRCPPGSFEGSTGKSRKGTHHQKATRGRRTRSKGSPAPLDRPGAMLPRVGRPAWTSMSPVRLHRMRMAGSRCRRDALPGADSSMGRPPGQPLDAQAPPAMTRELASPNSSNRGQTRS
jgi:hypothetical protein